MAKKKNVVREDVVQVSFEVLDDELIAAQREANEFQKDMSKGMKDAVKDVKKGTDNINKEFNSIKKDLRTTGTQSDSLKKDFDKLKNTKMSKLKSAFDDVKDKIRETKKEADELEGGLKDIGGQLGGIVAGLGVTASAGALVGSSMSNESAGSKLQAMTGASDNEAKAMQESMKNLYLDNMGESYEDLAVSMAEVRNQTGYAGDELERATYNALLMRDTFDFDVQESVRAADMMVKQFGISNDRAYDLMVQGAQNGLNKNGNLLDTMNEYGVHFKQMGFGAEDMMSMFSAAADKGVFDIDKIGDAVKEFGIRAVDGSDSTADAFEALGLDAIKMGEKFKAGGDEGKKAFQETIKALEGIKDPLKREQVGVALFGTMWEDLGAEAVLAMGKTKGEITDGTEALEELGSVRYDNATSALMALGRQVNTALSGPINKLLPSLTKGFQFVGKHLNVILPILATFGVLMGLGALATSGMTLAQGIMNGLMIAFKPIMLAAKGAQLLFNTTLLGCPLVWIVLGIAAVIAAVVLLVKNWDTVKQKLTEVWGKLKEGVSNLKSKFVESFQAMKEKISEKISGIKDTVIEKVTGILDFFSGLKDTMIQKGRDMIEGFKQGIEEAKEGIKGGVGKIADKVQEGLEWFKFGSPSRKLAQYGRWTAEGFGGGLEEKANMLKGTVKDVLANPFKSTSDVIVRGENDYVATGGGYSRASNTETNYFNPQFNLTVASGGDRDTERKVRKWVKESLQETFESMNRRNGRLTEV